MCGMFMKKSVMKHRDLKPCMVCGKGVMHNRSIQFYRVKVDFMMVDLAAVQRAQGLEQMLGGNAMIANAMGPDEDLAVPTSTVEGLLCLDCGIRHCVASTLEMANED